MLIEPGWKQHRGFVVAATAEEITLRLDDGGQHRTFAVSELWRFGRDPERS